MYKQIILSHLLEYFDLKKINYKKKGNIVAVQCPICNTVPISAQKLPNVWKINCFKCNKKYDLIDISRKLDFDEKQPNDDEVVLQHLKKLLNINVQTKRDSDEIDTFLDFYIENGFSLVPIASNKKFPPLEKEWTKKEHKNSEEWKQWLNNKLNVGVRTGQVSNITIIDIDQKPIPKELQDILGDTLKQESTKGWHYFYKYEKELVKTRIEEYKIDVENNGGYVVIYPSKINGIERKLGELKPIIEMPKKLKEFLKSKITVPRQTQSEKIKDEIKTESFNLGLLGEGQRNCSLIKLGGILRKELNLPQTSHVLNILNKTLCKNPLPHREMSAMVDSLDHYVATDERELAHKILEYLKEVKSSTKSDLELVVSGQWTKGETKKQLNKIIRYLVNEDKIIERGKKIEIIEEMEWKDDLVNVGVPVDFKIPYLNDHAYFNWGDMIVIASKSKYGKTHLGINVIKRLVSQGIKPYYLYSETGGRFAKIAMHLGMKDGDFYHSFISDPRKLILPKQEHAVIIFDWIRPPEFNKTDDLFAEFIEKIKKTNAIMIGFMQLKNNNNYFADNLVLQYPALVCKYIYEDDNDGTYTKFQITEIRDGKMKGKGFEIPCKYCFDTKEVKLIEEVEKEEK